MRSEILDDFDELIEHEPEIVFLLLCQDDIDELQRRHPDLFAPHSADLDMDPDDIDGRYMAQYRGVPLFETTLTDEQWSAL